MLLFLLTNLRLKVNMTATACDCVTVCIIKLLLWHTEFVIWLIDFCMQAAQMRASSISLKATNTQVDLDEKLNAL